MTKPTPYAYTSPKEKSFRVSATSRKEMEQEIKTKLKWCRMNFIMVEDYPTLQVTKEQMEILKIEAGVSYNVNKFCDFPVEIVE